MKVAYVYAGSWEFAYPQFREHFDQNVWCDSDDFIFKYPRSVMPYGVEPTLFYLTRSGRTTQDFIHKYGFRLRRIPVSGLSGPPGRETSLGLIRAICSESFDVLHFYSYYRNRRFLDMFDYFAMFCRLTGRRFVCHFQGGQFPAIGHRGPLIIPLIKLRRQIKRAALASASRILSCSRLEIDRLTDQHHPEYYGFPFSSASCAYVPNIVDPALFHPMGKDEACRRTGLDSRRRYVLYVGFFRQAKGIQHLLSVWPELIQEHPALTLVLVGDGEYEKVLRDRVNCLGIGDNVVFIGPVSNHQLCPYYNIADVHVLPSDSEGLPSVILEAIACGVPSIGTRVGGIPDVLGGGVGQIVPPGSVESLGSAIRNVLAGRFSMNEDRRKSILSEYSYDTAGHILNEIYNDIIAGATRKEMP